jgi:DNA-binding MarR family transcriptional regulator
MVVALKQALDALPPKRRAEIDRRFKELINEVESLRELRRISEKSQAKIAKTLKISQPAVSKID